MPTPASILLVDDDPSMTRTSAMILERKGCQVTTAASGEEAIERVRATPFDLIFLDIKMPGLDGVQTLRAIKGIRPQVRVVIVTAYAQAQQLREVVGEGAVEILYKPEFIEQMVELVAALRPGSS